MDKEPEIPESYILVRFASPGSALCDIQFINVTPSQVLGAASMIEVKGRSAFLMQEEAREQRQREQQLAVPRPEILVAK